MVGLVIIRWYCSGSFYFVALLNEVFAQDAKGIGRSMGQQFVSGRNQLSYDIPFGYGKKRRRGEKRVSY
jgi:hypothetical protein